MDKVILTTFRILQFVLIIGSIAGIVSFITNVNSVQYDSYYGWTITRMEGGQRFVSIALSVFFMSWYLLNRARNPIGYWIGVGLGSASLIWNFIMIFVVFFAWNDGMLYSLLYSFGQSLKTALVFLLLWKLWIPLKIVYRSNSIRP